MLTRDALKDTGWLKRIRDAAEGTVRIQTEGELEASRRQVLARHPENSDLWLFGYGSLIWNPAFHYEERVLGRIYGYHRCFCLWTHLGRGSRECPGLMLGLDRGGCCSGVLFRLSPRQIAEELPLVWRREMITAAYRPVWLKGRTANGAVQAIAFVIDRSHERYASGLDQDAIAEAIARAEGPLGRCADYLVNTTEHLAELGIRDRRLEALCRRIDEVQA